MKKQLLCTLFISFLSSSAFGEASGFYVGAQAGVGKIDTSDYKDWFNKSYQAVLVNATTSSFSSDEGGFSGRLFAGYNFNEYFGIEGGYTSLAKNNYGYNIAYSYSGGSYNYNRQASFDTSAVDLVGKAYLPLKQLSNSLVNFKLSARLGVAYVTQNISSSYRFTEKSSGEEIINIKNNSDITNRSWQPTYGLGAEYDVNKNISIDLSWIHVDGDNKNIKVADFKDFSAASDLISLGVIYRF